MCVVHYARLFGVLREDAIGAHDITNAGHYEKSLCSDNDRAVFCAESVIICLDWVALSRRLLMSDLNGFHVAVAYDV